MGQLLEQAVSPAVLNAAWKGLADDRAVWAPGLSRAEMARDLVFHLTQLADELRALSAPSGAAVRPRGMTSSASSQP